MSGDGIASITRSGDEEEANEHPKCVEVDVSGDAGHSVVPPVADATDESEEDVDQLNGYARPSAGRQTCLLTSNRASKIGSPKRRKIDAEGFVTPTTPDIPMTSVHYQEKTYKEFSSEPDFEQWITPYSYTDESDFKDGNWIPGKSDAHENSSFDTPPEKQQPAEKTKTKTTGKSENVPETPSSYPLENELVPNINPEAKFIGISNEMKDIYMSALKEAKEIVASEDLTKAGFQNLIEQARKYRRHLKDQKRLMMSQLQKISRTLSLSPPGNSTDE